MTKLVKRMRIIDGDEHPRRLEQPLQITIAKPK